MTRREYWKCSDCCSIVVDEGERRETLACICGGKFASMGRVMRKSRLLVGHRSETPCDTRCTHASGPACDCPCGGENHGTGLVLTVEITEGVPRATPVASEVAMARALEWRQAKSACKDKIESTYSDVVQALGLYVSPQGYRRRLAYYEARAALNRASRLRTHGGRLKAIKALAESLDKGG